MHVTVSEVDVDPDRHAEARKVTNTNVTPW
jgi:hypothetical protein